MAPEIIISIITPAYNAAETLPRLYESILQQTFQQFEWIVVNDGSTDNTHEVLNTLLKGCPFEVQIFEQDNQGVSSARNRGLSASTGKYLFFADADDYLFPSTLEKLYGGILLGYDFCFGNYVPQWKSGEVITQLRYPYKTHGYNTIEKLFKRICKKKIKIFASAGLYNKSIIDNIPLSFNASLTHTEDDLFLFQYLCYCKNAIHINENIYNYILGDQNSIYRISKKRMLGTVSALELLKATMHERHIPDKHVTAFENSVFREKFNTLFLLYFKEFHSLDFMELPEIKALQKRITRIVFNDIKGLKELIKLKGLFLIYNKLLN